MIISRRAVIGALALSLACSASPLMAQSLVVNPDQGVTETEIKLGWMGDETGAGATVNLPHLYGLQAFVEHINKQGGVLGKQVTIYHLDDKFTPDNATVNFRRLVNDEKVLAITNMGGSQVTTPLAPAVLEAKIPVIFPVQTIDAQLNNPYFFNITSHFADQADVMVASAAREVGGADKLKMYVARLNVPSGEEFDRYIQESLKAQGGSYAGAVTIAATQTEYTPTAFEIKAAMDAGANYVVVHGPIRTGLGLFTALSRNGIEVPIIGIQAMASPTIFTQSPPEILERFGSVQSVLPPSDGVQGAKAMMEFLAANPSYQGSAGEPYFAQGWLAGEVFKQAAEKAAAANGGALNRETLYQALQDKFATGGLSCELDFTVTPHYTPCATTIGWDTDHLIAKEPFSAFAGSFRAPYRQK